MKFLCPSCKAKYQIADEKVIGRTVKMKCRQCGHVIEINEAVIGGGSMSGGLTPGRATMHESAGSEQGELGSRVVGKGRPPPKPARVPTPAAGTPATRGSTPQRRGLGAPATGGSRAVGTDAERPHTSVVPVPRPAPIRQSSMATSPAVPPSVRVEAAPPSSRRPPTAAKTAPVSRESSSTAAASALPTVGRLPGVPETVVSSLSLGSARPVGSSQDALAGAFTKAVTSHTTQTQTPDHPLAGDEWYVGIDDSPVGPIRLAEIRDRAAKGEVTPECLVWRDGFEDWKPLTTFPELVAVVEEGIASLRSLRPPPPSTEALAPVASSSTSTPGEPQLASLGALGSSAPAGAQFDDDALVAAGLSKPKIPLAAWFAIAMALVLGVTIGLVFMRPEPPKEVVKYVEVPVSAKPLGAEVQPPAPAGQESETSEAANGENAAAGEKRGTSGTRKAPLGGASDAPTAGSSEISQGLKGLQGLQGLGAPRSGPASNVAASSGSRQQLDSATLSRTVSRYTASVKRSCWQPALDTRAPDASTSARISANIVVGPSGKVQKVTVSPDPKGYRGLSSCIQSRVRNWEFPPAGGSTEFNVPFVFAAQ